MNSLLPKRPKREVFELQLTAMIDIFAMLIIFLVKGTVFGVADIVIPPETRLPKSMSRESMETAPQVWILKDEVKLSIFQESLPFHVFDASQTSTPRGEKLLSTLKQRLRDYVAKLSSEARSSGVLLNVIADRDTPYKKVFDTLRVFRECGFEVLLFVATGAIEKSETTEGNGQ